MDRNLSTNCCDLFERFDQTLSNHAPSSNPRFRYRSATYGYRGYPNFFMEAPSTGDAEDAGMGDGAIDLALYALWAASIALALVAAVSLWFA